MTVLYDTEENIVGKGENAGPAFSPFPTRFSKAFYFRAFKSRDNVVGLTCLKNYSEFLLAHSHTMTPFDASGKQAF